MFRVLTFFLGACLAAAASYFIFNDDGFSFGPNGNAPVLDTSIAQSTCDPSSISMRGYSKGDKDSDGLPDHLEKKYGTAINRADTDYDGYSDCDEIINKAYNIEEARLSFNPLIADLPSLDVSLVSAPFIEVLWSESNIQSVSAGKEVSEQSTEGISQSQGGAETASNELSSTIGASATVGTEVGLTSVSVSAEVTASYEQASTSSNSTTVNWNEERVRENSRALSQIENRERTTGKSAEKGRITMAVRLKNTGNITVTVGEMLLTAYMTEPRTNNLIPLGVFLPERSDFETTLIPQSEITLVLRADDVSVATTKSLLKDSRSLIVEPTSFQLFDRDGKAFAHNMTGVLATTSQIIIDYGQIPQVAGPSYESYRVAVAHNQNGKTSVADILTNVLKVNFETGLTEWCNVTITNSGECESPETIGPGLLMMRGVSIDGNLPGYWSVSLSTLSEDGLGLRQRENWTITNGDEYDFDKIYLRPRDVLSFVYVTDADRDGLGDRSEYLLGTNPRRKDSDYDGLTDLIETFGYVEKYRTLIDTSFKQSTSLISTGESSIIAYREVITDPALKDTDGDSVSDYDEYMRYSIRHGAEMRDEVAAIIFDGCDFTKPVILTWPYPSDIKSTLRFDRYKRPILSELTRAELPSWRQDNDLGNQTADILQSSQILYTYGYWSLVNVPTDEQKKWSLKILPGYELLEYNSDTLEIKRRWDEDQTCLAEDMPSSGISFGIETIGIRKK
jgi:hypothetical protein